MSTIKTTTLSTQGGSTVPVDTVVNGTAKAWVNFNGTGTVAIRRAFNVSSVTDRNVGRYTVNLTTAMPDSNFTVSCVGSTNNGDNVGESFQAYAASTTTIPITAGTTSAYLDAPTVCIAIFS